MLLLLLFNLVLLLLLLQVRIHNWKIFLLEYLLVLERILVMHLLLWLGLIGLGRKVTVS